MGEVRIENDGKMYVLAQADENLPSGRILVYSTGSMQVSLAAAGDDCAGVNHNTSQVDDTYYFWMQVYGRCEIVNAAGSAATWIKSNGAGVGADGAATEAVVGIGITAHAAGVQPVFIDPRSLGV